MDTIILAIDPTIRLLGRRTITKFRCIPFVASPLDSHRRSSPSKKTEGSNRGATCEVEKRENYGAGSMPKR
jgi:hypothetical protein